MAIGITLLTGSVLATADLELLGRESGAVPVDRIVGELLQRFQAEGPDGPDRKHALLEGFRLPVLPLESELTLSREEAGIRRVRAPLPKPVCVIGTDRISLEWLKQHRRRLARMGASCLLIEARNRDEVESIRRLAHPLRMQPAPFDDLSAVIGLRTLVDTNPLTSRKRISRTRLLQRRKKSSIWDSIPQPPVPGNQSLLLE